MPLFFQFEADFVESLRCIPMQVRYNLDSCGVKLKLQHWHQFNPSQREQLVNLPCETMLERQLYRQYLQDWVLAATGQVPSDLPVEDCPAWMVATAVPTIVQEKAQSCDRLISLAQWAGLSPLQRFALIKLSRSSHENANFLPALQEFGL